MNQTDKQNVGRKLLHLVDIFMPGDVSTVRGYILKEVVGPTLKKLLYDIIVGSSYRMIFPESQGQRLNENVGVDYNSIVPSGRSSLNGTITASEITKKQITWYNNAPIIPTRERAEKVLTQLLETIHTYGFASVNDYYDFLGVSTEHTSTNYGWDDLSKADIISAANGYQIRLPKAKQIMK